jgi:hypothetical protein
MTVKAQNDYCGITKWHNAGITGNGVVVWNMENSKATHGKQTTQRVLHSAPDATIINATLSMSSDNKSVKYANAILDDGTTYKVEDFIKQFNIKCLTRSVGGSTANSKTASEFWTALQKKYKLIMFNSAGNEGSDGRDGGNDYDPFIYVGALSLNKNGIWIEPYSSEHDRVDFATFRGEWSGTSFSAPYLCGQSALLVQKYGHHIDQEFVYEYFKSHATDLHDIDYDTKTGWGLPIMGDPKTVIKMQVGNFKATVDGKTVIMDVAPKIENQRTLVPLRFISEALGAEVGWDDKTKTVTIVR